MDEVAALGSDVIPPTEAIQRLSEKKGD